MSNKVINIWIFAFGIAVGSIVTWRYEKLKYEQLIQEEINSVKETFSKREPLKTDHKEDSEKIKTDKQNENFEIIDYSSRLNKEGYVNYSDNQRVTNKKTSSKTKPDAPYVLVPDEFGAIDEYDTISLTYYADEILADDNDDVINNVEDIVGLESLKHFGEYEDDSVFVRNDRLKCDYEILLDQRAYSDVIKKHPRTLDKE